MPLENSLSSTCTHWRHIQLRDRTEREVVFSLRLRRYVPSEKQPTYTHSAVFSVRKTDGQLWEKWKLWDSNPGPTGYEPVALTN